MPMPGLGGADREKRAYPSCTRSWRYPYTAIRGDRNGLLTPNADWADPAVSLRPRK